MKPDTILKVCLIAAAMISLVLSITIYFSAGEDDISGRLNGVYVGVWVPSILSLGALLLVARKTDS